MASRQARSAAERVRPFTNSSPLANVKRVGLGQRTKKKLVPHARLLHGWGAAGFRRATSFPSNSRPADLVTRCSVTEREKPTTSAREAAVDMMVAMNHASPGTRTSPQSSRGGLPVSTIRPSRLADLEVPQGHKQCSGL